VAKKTIVGEDGPDFALEVGRACGSGPAEGESEGETAMYQIAYGEFRHGLYPRRLLLIKGVVY
jgi:hypothetical protein